MKKRYKRVFLTVLDGFGVGTVPGELVESSSFEDTVKAKGDVNIPNLAKMGLVNLINSNLYNEISSYNSHYGKMRLSSMFKDSWAGHWELAGHSLADSNIKSMETGFTSDIIKKFENATGFRVLGNKAFQHRNDVLPDLLDEHFKDEKSVIVLTEKGLESIRTFGIYAHVDIISLDKQYEICEIASEILVEYNEQIGRVGARPLSTSENGETIVPHHMRKDYLIFDPPQNTLLTNLEKNNINTYAVGKVWAMFKGVGVKDSISTKNNDGSVEGLLHFAEKVSEGLIFTNLNDWDAKYAHYYDIDGWINALERFDNQISSIISILNDDDLLILCSDGHGCDPVNTGLHTREYSPLIIYNHQINTGVFCKQKV